MVVQRRTAGQPADQEAMEEGQGQGKPQLAGGMWAGREGCGESASPQQLALLGRGDAVIQCHLGVTRDLQLSRDLVEAYLVI